MEVIRRFIVAFGKAEALPGCLLLFGHLLLFQPALIYQGNSPFFFSSFLNSTAWLIPIFAVSVILFVLPSMGRPSPGKRIYSVAMGGLAVVVWINTSFDRGSSGLLDGQTFELIKDQGTIWRNAGLLAVLFSMTTLVAARFKEKFALFLFTLICALTGVFGFVVVTDAKPWSETSSGGELAKFSSTQNVLVILLDAFQSDFLLELVRRGQTDPGALDGFTFFNNVTGVAPTTYLSIPAIHSGQLYTSGDNLTDYYQNAVVQGSVLNTLSDSGYDSIVINSIRDCPAKSVCVDDASIDFGQSLGDVRTAATLFDLSLFRAMPHVLKPFIFRDGSWLVTSAISQSRNYVSNKVLDFFAENADVSSPRPTVKFLHLFSTHAPAELDKDCREIKGVAWTRESAVNQSACAMEHVKRLLETLKDRSIYDQTAIILLADHGAGLPAPGASEKAAMASPLLLVKPIKAKGDLKISEVPASLIDVPATICALVNACDWSNGVDVFTLDAKTARERDFLMYAWRHKYWRASDIPIERYSIRGPVDQVTSWHGAPRRGSSALAFSESDAADSYDYGWSGFEANNGRTWRWAVGPEAALHIRTLGDQGAQVVMNVATHGGNEGQVISIMANDHPIGHFPVSAKESSKITFDVAAAAVREGSVRLSFKFSKWNRPSEHDHRELAVMFDDLAIIPSQKP